MLCGALAGDRDAANGLWRQYRPWIDGYVRKRARTVDDAEDLVQNIFLRAARNLANFRGECSFPQWLLRIAANELKNYYERVLGRQPSQLHPTHEKISLDLQQAGGEPGPYERTEARLDAEAVLEVARSACSEVEVAVLMMVYQGESMEEIAELSGMNAATVRSHFLRARGKLLARLMVDRPDMVGGVPAIEAAMNRLRAEGAVSEREEIAAQAPSARSEAFRSVCIKIARYLPLPVLALLVGGMR